MKWILKHSTACAAILLSIGLLSGCEEAAQQQVAPPPPSVIVETITKQQINPSTQFSGRIEAVEDVSLQARVEGYLMARPFHEGDYVKKGTLLFELDPKPFAAEVRQKEAALKQASAKYEVSLINYKRGKRLLPKGSISAVDFDEITTAKITAEASVAQAEAALDAAKLNQGYTQILAPIDGRIGASNVSIGDLINPSTGVLTTLVQQEPMHVIFNASETQILDAYELRKSGQVPALNELSLNLELSNKSMYDQQGKIDFIDNRIDPTTGTVQIRASFPNPDHVLQPGQFGNIIIASSDPIEALLIPQVAVQEDQKGRFAMVVNNENIVERRDLEVHTRQGIYWIIDAGLMPNERVIIQGLQRVRVGAEVKPQVQQIKPFADQQ
ncbi:efflux RND transporter periplasmic adaptor subunit [Photobacterium sanguinicancri]|uniref:efflux RND transporter periplasmic adaptor subunit n=1 Tax=Photobacterium sanguinicancri TaxID=875932 RepID=UPI0026E38732|nr:efflux RND transporter periplasmic adaptor subunit [Photobacterium sanguinicancri]MDO6497795.1 efflux RND transporter periplasmic adaptor subunit [Photobacterium sanguinicancri]